MKKSLIALLLTLTLTLSAHAEDGQIRQIEVVKDYSQILAGLSARITLLEEENRKLYGKVEELEYNVRRGNNVDPKNANNMVDREDYYVSRPGKTDGEYVIRVKNEKEQQAAPSNLPFRTAATGEEAEFNTAFALLGRVDYIGARQGFEAFIRQNPDSDYTSRSFFWLGEIDFLEKKYSEATVNYLKGYKKHPTGKRAGESLVKAAQSLHKLNRQNDACNNLKKYQKEFPNDHSELRRLANKTAIELRCS